jgi:hypothetical protein
MAPWRPRTPTARPPGGRHRPGAGRGARSLRPDDGAAAGAGLAQPARWRTSYPEVWQWYLDRTPPEYHDEPTGYHFARILGDDEKACKESAYAYTAVDTAITELDDRFKPPRSTTSTPARTSASALHRQPLPRRTSTF